jgi:hypothetical protein
LIYASRNIDTYKKLFNSRKLGENDTIENDTIENDTLENDTIEINDGTQKIDSTNEEVDTKTVESGNYTYNISQLLLLGFDRYRYNDTNNLIQFYTYIKIVGLEEIENISFTVSITSNRSLRNLEEEEVNIIGTKEGNMVGDKNTYSFNCTGEYNKTPLQVKFFKDKDFFINGIKINKSLDLNLTSYAEYLSSNIQDQISENPYLLEDPLNFNNSKIVNQNKNITIEGEYDDEYSKNAYLFSKEESDKHIPCLMEKKVGTKGIFSLDCKPSSSFVGDLNDYLVNLTDIKHLMFFEFSENNSFVNYTIEEEKAKNNKKDSSKKISAGIIVLIILACIAVLAILGVMFYCMRKNGLKSPPNQSQDKNNNTLGVNQYNSSSNITN